MQPLEHAAGFNGENETCVGSEAQMLRGARNAVSPASEVGAVNFDGPSRQRVRIDNREPACDGTAMQLAIEAQLLTRSYAGFSVTA